MAEKKPLCIYSGKLKELQSGDTVPDTAHASLTNNPHSVTASQAGAIPEAGSSTDNAITRWDGTDGDALQNSNVSINDDGDILPKFSSSQTLGSSSYFWLYGYVNTLRGYYNSGANIGINSNIYPTADGTRYCGVASYRWHTVYSVNGVTSSDKNLKKNIQNAVLGLDFILSLNPKSWQWKKVVVSSDINMRHGLIAQEVAEVISPLNFSGIHRDVIKDEKTGEEKEYWGLDYSQFIGPLIKAVQEQQAQIETQQATIDSLTARLEKLEKMSMPKDNGIK